MNQSLYSALWLEKIAMGIGIGLIVMVAALNIVASLILLVMEKSRDIAILKTMGASARSVMLIFLMQGVIIGVVGTAVGALHRGLASPRARPLPAHQHPERRLPGHVPAVHACCRGISPWSSSAPSSSASWPRCTPHGRPRGSTRRRRCGTSSHP
jgi:hypothetical protein